MWFSYSRITTSGGSLSRLSSEQADVCWGLISEWGKVHDIWYTRSVYTFVYTFSGNKIESATIAMDQQERQQYQQYMYTHSYFRRMWYFDTFVLFLDHYLPCVLKYGLLRFVQVFLRGVWHFSLSGFSLLRKQRPSTWRPLGTARRTVLWRRWSTLRLTLDCDRIGQMFFLTVYFCP